MLNFLPTESPKMSLPELNDDEDVVLAVVLTLVLAGERLGSNSLETALYLLLTGESFRRMKL